MILSPHRALVEEEDLEELLTEDEDLELDELLAVTATYGSQIHFALHPSPSLVFPSSHCSSLVGVPSPQTPGLHTGPNDRTFPW